LRRILALLLVTPLLANCADSPTPLTPPEALHSNEVTPEEAEWMVQQEEDVSTQGAPNSSAVMALGNPDVGTGYSPGSGHDASWHANDRMRPGTVVIDAGESVTFQVYPGHRVAIYDDGTRPQDIVPNPGPFVLDPVNRLAIQGAPTPTYSYTFNEPGRYLVICAIARHFFEANMYGWVIVR
jgi:plastocyanin